MRARKPAPIISRPKAVEAVAEIPTPTVIVSRAEGNSIATVTFAPGGARFDLRVGVTPRDRALVALDEHLHERACGAAQADVFPAVLERVPSFRPGMLPELQRLAEEWVCASSERAGVFHRLVSTLGLVSARFDQENLQRVLRRAKVRLRPS